MLYKPKYINVGGSLIDLTVPKVMGIINVTPDSFYKGSRVSGEKEIIEKAFKMNEEGADILDIGGYSSRPNADDVTEEDEKKRVLYALKLIRRELPDAILSVDTFRATIAEEAVNDCGANIINDISGGDADAGMFGVVKKLNVPYIMMHMAGTPKTMQEKPFYNDVVADILKWFSKRIVKLQSEGVKDIILDPGIGFGKSISHNFEILKRLEEFSIGGLPVLIGVSRKSMIWKTLGITPDDALSGTVVLNTVALMGGADIIRVHDVREAVQTIKLVKQLKLNKKEFNQL
jgi:dihydropteroate synthase